MAHSLKYHLFCTYRFYRRYLRRVLLRARYRTLDALERIYWKFKKHREVGSVSFDEDQNPSAMRRWDEAHGIDAKFYICITKADGKKCARCWIFKIDVDSHMWANVCGRCNDVCQGIWENDLTDEQKLDWMDYKEIK